MEPQNINTQSTGRHEKLLTEVVQKQMALLGPKIALTTARNVSGITVNDQGVVTELSGDHQVLTQQLVEQFMALSGLIVKKTLEPLLSVHESSPYQTPPQAVQNTPVPNNNQYGS